MSTADSRSADDDPFVILGVSRDCTLSELKRAYRLLALRYHPDINPGREAAEQMSRINLAYSRALRQVERTARMQSAQASATGVVRQTRHMQAAPGQTTTRAAAAAPAGWRAQRTRGRRIWIITAASIGAGVLILLTIVYALVAPPRTPKREAPQTSNPTTLRLGGTTVVNWHDTSNVTITERLLARFTPPDTRLIEPPQWSPDRAYVAVSVAPARSTSNAPATTLLWQVQGSRPVTTLLATKARWSPVTDQLAVLTEPGSSGTPQLELVSPAAPQSPIVLDPHAGTHLAWSSDGQQIAYDAHGQQQLRLATIARGSYQTLMREPSQRLIPLGWQNGQIVTIVHMGSVVSLVTVDPLHRLTTTLGYLDANVTDADIAISRHGIAYATQASGAPLMTLYWDTPHPQQQVPLRGLQSVRFLAGWPKDETWMALAPAPSSARTSEICLTPAPQPTAPPATSLAVACLLLPGTLAGISWEPQSNTLSYVRMAEPGSALELRELRIQPAQALASGHAIQALRAIRATRKPTLVSSGPLALIAGVVWRSQWWPSLLRG